MEREVSSVILHGGWSIFYINQCTVWHVETNSALLKLFTDMDHLGATEQRTSLDISGNYIGANGIPPLIQVMKTWIGLKQVNMSNNLIDSANCNMLVDMAKKHPTLTSLNLSHNPIFDSGGRFLLNLVRYNRNIVELHLDGLDIKETLLRKIAAAVVENIAIQQGPPPTPPPPLDLAILPPLPPSPSPFITHTHIYDDDNSEDNEAAEGDVVEVELFEPIKGILVSLYSQEVSSNDGGTRFTQQHRDLLSLLTEYGTLGVQLFSDFGFQCLPLLKKFGYLLTETPVQQEMEILTTNFSECVDQDGVLQTQLEVLHEVLSKHSTTEVVAYLAHIRRKLQTWGCESAHDSTQYRTWLLARKMADTVKERLLVALHHRQLVYIVHKLDYFEPETTNFVSTQMHQQHSVSERGQIPTEWDWYDMVNFWHKHNQMVPDSVKTERRELLAEVVSLIPSCVVEFLLYCVLVELQDASQPLQYLHCEPNRPVSPPTPVDVPMPTLPRFSLHKIISNTHLDLGDDDHEPSAGNGSDSSATGSERMSMPAKQASGHVGGAQPAEKALYFGDMLEIVKKFWDNEENINVFCEKLCLWLCLQDEQYLQSCTGTMFVV